MDRQIEGRDSAEYLWAVKRVVHPSLPRTRTMRPPACPSRRASRTSSRTSRRLGPLDSGYECHSPTQPRYVSRFSLQLFIEQLLGGVLGMLGDLGVALIMERPEPLDPPDATPFPDDFHHHDYDPFWISPYWRILSEVNLILEELAGEFSGKTSPVHHFWHTMDIAVTRFSDREVFHPASVDSVTREGLLA